MNKSKCSVTTASQMNLRAQRSLQSVFTPHSWSFLTNICTVERPLCAARWPGGGSRPGGRGKSLWSGRHCPTWAGDGGTQLWKILETYYTMMYFYIHPTSPAYPRSGRRGSSISREPQTSLSLATLSSSDWGIPRCSQASMAI